MVSVQCSYTVIPSEPTPNTKLFSLCEQIKLHTHTPLLFVYKSHVHHNIASSSSSSTFNFAVQTLRNSLSQALCIYYPLAGRLSWIEGGERWELHCNAKGAELLEAYCERNLDDLGDFVPTQLVSQLIPNIDYGVPIGEMPLLVVQVTRFRCGGLTIVVSVCRAIIDGKSLVRFLNTWAKLARGQDLDYSKEMPCHDRTSLDSHKLNSVLYHHAEFYPPPVWLGSLRDTRVISTNMKLTVEQIKKLKKKAVIVYGNRNIASAAQRPYSTFEAIAGHLWRCVSKARYEGNGDQPTRLSTLVNCRNRLRPPLPDGYAGNATFPTVTPTCSFHDLMHKPLSYATGKVREALERVTDEFVRSALDYIANEKYMNLLRYNFHYPDSSVHKGPSKGNPNLSVVSWMNFSYKDTDFGWGKPVYFGPASMNSEGKAILMDNANGDGLIIAIALDASLMDAFKKLFSEDIQEVLPTAKL